MNSSPRLINVSSYILFAVIALPGAVYAYSSTMDTEQAPIGQNDVIFGYHGTSSPAAADCSTCHTGGSYTNSGTSLSGSGSVSHGSTNAYSLSISSSNAVRIGFNLAIYNASDVKQTGGNAPSPGDASSIATNDEISHSSPQLPSHSWSFDWTAPDTLGTYTMYYCINQVNFDGDGYTVGDGPPACSSRSISVINNAPTAVNDTAGTIPGALSISESASTTFNAISGGPGLNDNDPEDDDIDIVSINTTGTTGSVTLNNGETGSITYDTNGQFEYLAAGESTTDSFSYTIQDDYGASYQDTGTVTVTINGVNDAPTLGAQSEVISVGEGGSTSNVTIGGSLVTTNLMANDSDPDTSDSLSVVYYASTTPLSTTAPSNGTLSINESNGTFTYTHNGSETISDSFTYRVTDGTTASALKTVTINIAPANDPPVAVNDTGINVNEGGSVLIDLVANDTDAELSTLTATSISAAGQGSITNHGDGTATYTHDGIDRVNLSDSFTYFAHDGFQASISSATVSITVIPQNDAPTAVDDNVTVESNSSNNTLNVLANDTDADLSDTMEIISVSATSQGGTVTINNPGSPGNSLNYTPATNVQTTETFSYTMQDGSGVQSSATVTVNFQDSDGDGIADTLDNCPSLSNAAQTDTDNDGLGDDCDADPNGNGALDTYIEFTVTRSTGAGNLNGSIIFGDDTLVSVQAALADPNISGNTSYDWTASNAQLLAIGSFNVNNDTLSFDPSSLAVGTYLIDVVITNENVPTHNTLLLNLLAASDPSAGLPATDSDGDGNNDDTEGYQDTDQDGIPDFRDDVDNDNTLLQKQTSGTPETIRYLQSATGTRLQLGDIAIASGRFGAGIDANDLQTHNSGSANTDDSGYESISEIFDFVISDLPQVGGSIDIVIPLSSSLLNHSVYRKFDALNGWQDFVIDSRNSLSSASSIAGICPAPGSTSYQSGLNAFDDCVQLTLQDGGPNDNDGEINGVIRDPGVFAVDSNAATGSANCEHSQFNNCVDQRGGIGAFAPLALLFLLPGLMLRRKNRI